jgi:hypothetical protein
MTPVVVFTTASDIEASVVMALLDSHGIDSFRVSGNPQGIWPMAVSALGEIRVAVAEADADQALRVIESHRQDVGARVVRLRDEFDDLQTHIAYRFRDRGLLEHALTHKSRAAEDASGGVADNESLEFLGDAVLGLVVADALFHLYPAYDEGPESKIKAAVVSTQSLQPDGMVLGLTLDVGDMFSRVLEELTLAIRPGDLFLLYTDGISEAMNVDGDCFGDARLADLASQHADLSSTELRGRILDEVRGFAGAAAQHDDMTMVLVKIDNPWSIDEPR